VPQKLGLVMGVRVAYALTLELIRKENKK